MREVPKFFPYMLVKSPSMSFNLNSLSTSPVVKSFSKEIETGLDKNERTKVVDGYENRNMITVKRERHRFNADMSHLNFLLVP